MGIKEGDCLLVHSSYKSLGGIEGGADGFFDVLLNLLGYDGTLVMPTLSYETVFRDEPVRFFQKSTPSCVGYLTEFFRTSIQGVTRSLHVSHSCSVTGKYAQFLIANHEQDTTPVGRNSPFTKLPDVDGKILMLGCSPDHNTSMHGIEETIDLQPFIDYSSPVPCYLVNVSGEEICRMSYKHNFYRNNGYYEQRYGRVLAFLDQEALKTGTVLDAHCSLIDSRSLWRVGQRILSKDPYSFVEWIPYTTEEQKGEPF